MASFKKIPGGGWNIYYWLDGKKRHAYGRKHLKANDIKFLKQEFNHRLARHHAGLEQFISPLKEGKSELTITSYQKWFFENKKTAIGRGREIRSRTLEVYERVFTILIETVGNVRLDRIPNHLNHIEERLNQYNPSSRSIYVRALRGAWNFGVDRDKIKDNPFKKIERGKTKKRPDFLTIEEIERIAATLKSENLILALALARYAGLRRHEIACLRWEDVYFDENLIRLPEAKEADNETVPVLQQLKDILLKYRKDSGPIITCKKENITMGLGRAKRRVGIQKIGAIHILRHSLATELIAQDTNHMIVQALLRHADPSTTQIYTHLSGKLILEKIKDKKL